MAICETIKSRNVRNRYLRKAGSAIIVRSEYEERLAYWESVNEPDMAAFTRSEIARISDYIAELLALAA